MSQSISLSPVQNINFVNSQGQNSVSELQLNGNTIWKYATKGFLFYGIDADGNSQYIAKTNGNILENDLYNGVPVKYSLGYSTPPSSASTTDAWFYYCKDNIAKNNGVDESSFDANANKLIIPGTHNALPVKYIRGYAIYASMPNLEEIDFNNGIQNIGWGAIHLTGLTKNIKLTLPKSVTEVSFCYYYTETSTDKLLENAIYLDAENAENNLSLDLYVKSENVSFVDRSIVSDTTYKGVVGGNFANKTIHIDSEAGNVPRLSGSGFSKCIINSRGKVLNFQNQCFSGFFNNTSLLICREDDANLLNIEKPSSGSSATGDSGLGYSKYGSQATIYTNNQALYDYAWSRDNITPTFYKLNADETPGDVVQRLDAPTASINGNILTIVPSSNSTRFALYNNYTETNSSKNRFVIDTTSTIIDLSQITFPVNENSLTVIAMGDGYVSSLASTAVSYTVS